MGEEGTESEKWYRGGGETKMDEVRMNLQGEKLR